MYKIEQIYSIFMKIFGFTEMAAKPSTYLGTKLKALRETSIE